MSILIAPGTSRTSSYVIQSLLSSKSSPRLVLLAHSSSSETRLKEQYPSVPIVVADLADSAALRSSMTSSGVKTVFLNLPLAPDAIQMGKNMIDASKEAGVDRFVLAGVIHPFISKMLNHKHKLEVEEYLFESGLSYTILEPTHLIQNTPLPQVIQSGVLNLPWASNIFQGFLDLADFGEVATNVLLKPSPTTHAYARYELTGCNTTYDEVVKIISERAGKQIKYVQSPKEEFADKRGASDPWTRERLFVICDYYGQRGIPGNTNTLRWLLGREPSKWEDVVDRELKAMSV